LHMSAKGPSFFTGNSILNRKRSPAQSQNHLLAQSEASNPRRECDAEYIETGATHRSVISDPNIRRGCDGSEKMLPRNKSNKVSTRSTALRGDIFGESLREARVEQIVDACRSELASTTTGMGRARRRAAVLSALASTAAETLVLDYLYPAVVRHGRLLKHTSCPCIYVSLPVQHVVQVSPVGVPRGQPTVWGSDPVPRTRLVC
jgi:hypothetical protein